METKSTKRPWRLHDTERNIVVAVTPTGGEAVADCNATRRMPQENAANAEFIVRACNAHDDMLDALSEMVADSDDSDDGVIPTISAATLVRARAALAKARGQ